MIVTGAGLSPEIDYSDRRFNLLVRLGQKYLNELSWLLDPHAHGATSTTVHIVYAWLTNQTGEFRNSIADAVA
jgi:hypothetical protein